MCELALAGAHQAAREAGLAATPATVLLAAAPGCVRPPLPDGRPASCLAQWYRAACPSAMRRLLGRTQPWLQHLGAPMSSSQ